MPTETEHDIQNSIRLALSADGWFTERINVGSGYLINKSMMDELKARVPKDLRERLSKVPYFSTGAVKGRPDLSAIKDGRIAFIEVKTDTGKLRPDQKHFIQEVRSRYGCAAGVARSVQDALDICNNSKE